MKNQFTILLGLFFVLLACQQRKVLKSGQIQLDLVVYDDPGGNLYDSFKLPISTLYFEGDVFLEQVPKLKTDLELPAYALIQEQSYIPVQRLSDLHDEVKLYPLGQKNFGAAFVFPEVPNYTDHRQLNDTIFDGQYLQRFEIVTVEEYSIFYLHPTDTVLPYSLCRQFEKDYSGIITRIDTYQRQQDRFLSLRLKYKGGPIPLRFANCFKK